MGLGGELMKGGGKVDFMIEDGKEGMGDEGVVNKRKGESWMGKGIGLNEVGGVEEGCDGVKGM